jgi:hypothetical protein
MCNHPFLENFVRKMMVYRYSSSSNLMLGNYRLLEASYPIQSIRSGILA